MSNRQIFISKLEMTNFKRFYGFHSVDLMPEPDINKSLILIGGDNGRGKSSIHEAINYVFYEDGELPGIQTKPSYYKAIEERLNRKAIREGQKEFSAAVELLLIDNGIEREIKIKRSWDIGQSNGTIPSKLQIFESGRPLDYLEDNPYAYSDFIRGLIPPKIAPFFFFDGERIREFADDADSAENEKSKH